MDSIVVPQGLSLQPDVITSETEANIISWLDNRTWSTEISRRTQHFGFEYNYTHKDLRPGSPLEGPILEIAHKIEKLGLMNPTQCIVNEYYRNQGIAPHIDNLVFGPTIISLSIGSDGVLEFTRKNSNNLINENQETLRTDKFECFLPRRSMMMITGPARYEWRHGIDKKVTFSDPDGQKIIKAPDYRRISLTYRELAKKDKVINQ
jgi:alkylated DNA repair dioxygenase AlkB